VLLFIYWVAFRSGRLNSIKLHVLFTLSVPILLLAAIQIAFGTNTLLIALYGVRSYLLHLPLVLIIADIFTPGDVKEVGRWLLIVSVPIAFLMLAQYRASSNSWLNATGGGDTGQIHSADGHVRASGPFSFISGPICFFPIAQAFLFYALGRPRTYPKWILVPSAAAVIMALPLSGSRTLLFIMGGVATFALVSGFRTRRAFGRLIQALAIVGIGSVVALQVPVIQEAVHTFQDRWQAASQVEGDLEGTLSIRVLGVVTNAFDSAGTGSWLGEGIGMGSNVAAYLQTGSLTFLVAEMEWQRVVLEFGPILGLGFMMFRVLICADLFSSALRALKRDSNLSLMLVAATAPVLLMNFMEQPTSLGFMVFGAGLCFAAAKRPSHRSSCHIRSDAARLSDRVVSGERRREEVALVNGANLSHFHEDRVHGRRPQGPLPLQGIN